jgi:hypothetical protein
LDLPVRVACDVESCRVHRIRAWEGVRDDLAQPRSTTLTSGVRVFVMGRLSERGCGGEGGGGGVGAGPSHSEETPLAAMAAGPVRNTSHSLATARRARSQDTKHP